METMLHKKQIWAIFLFEFKTGRKAVETTLNINNAFGPGMAKECTVQCWFKKFFKGDKNLEDEERSGRPLKVDSFDLWTLSLCLLPSSTPPRAAFEITVLDNLSYRFQIQYIIIWTLKTSCMKILS